MNAHSNSDSDSEILKMLRNRKQNHVVRELPDDTSDDSLNSEDSEDSEPEAKVVRRTVLPESMDTNSSSSTSTNENFILNDKADDSNDDKTQDNKVITKELKIPEQKLNQPEIKEPVDISSSDDSSNSEPEAKVVRKNGPEPVDKHSVTLENKVLPPNTTDTSNEKGKEEKMIEEPKITEPKSDQQDQIREPKMSTKEYRNYVMSTSTVFVVDNVKLYVKNSVLSGLSTKGHRIHLDCPCCTNGTVEPYTKIGEHLRDQHDVTHISCPGARCGKFKEISVKAFRDHLETFHMTILCPHCTKPLSALKIIDHILAIHPNQHDFGKGSKQETLNLRYKEQKARKLEEKKAKQMSQNSGLFSQNSGLTSQNSGLLSQNSGLVSRNSGLVSQNPTSVLKNPMISHQMPIIPLPTILPNEKVLSNNQTPPQLPMPFTFSQQLEHQMNKNQSSPTKIVKSKLDYNEPKIGMKKISVTYEVLHNGQLVIVDGVHFFVRSKVAFVDCPKCVSKSMSMSLLPNHLREEHFLDHVQCPADENLCGKILPLQTLLQHIGDSQILQLG
jgi:hypothetical protein